MPFAPPPELEDVSQWHFAVGGLDTRDDVVPFGGAIRLRRLKSFPTGFTLSRRLQSVSVAGVMDLHGEAFIRHELIVDAEPFDDFPERIFPTAEALLAGLRIRTGAEIVCPAVSERSWELTSHTPPLDTRAYHFERGLAQPASAEPRMLLPDDPEWVCRNLATVIRLSEDESFQTALEALCTYMLATNDRMKVAQLWTGFEAVFDIEYELRWRLATLSAKLLGTTPAAARAIYDEMKTLYGERSKIIHGKRIGKSQAAHEEKLRTHIVRMRARLAELLAALVARGKIPTDTEFEDMLFDK